MENFWHKWQPDRLLIGNAALSGGAFLLFNKKSVDKINSVIDKSNFIDLGASKVFMDYYIDCMEI